MSAETHVSLYVKCPVMLSHFNQNCTVRINKSLQYQISFSGSSCYFAKLAVAYLQLFVANAQKIEHKKRKEQI
jgi:hypothetical protein